MFSFLADAVVVLHAVFVLFVVCGGVLVSRWRWLAWMHLPAVVWGVLIEYSGWICPLTPLENALRERAGESVYSGDFIGHYVLPLLYPADLTRGAQIVLGSAALVLNLVIYLHVLRTRPRPSQDVTG